MRVAARIFHPSAPPAGRTLECWLHDAKVRLAERHVEAFGRAGAEDAQVVAGPGPGQAFGARLRELVAELDGIDGLVLLGSGALALARAPDLRRFVGAARAPEQALANNRYSADIVAIGGLRLLSTLPDLRTDNALPRWLEEVAGYRVADLRSSWRLGVDLDSPVDVLLVGLDRGSRLAPVPPGIDVLPVRERIRAVAEVAASPTAELLVAGRTSAATLSWLEGQTSCRVRAIIEERGLRAGVDGNLALGSSRANRPERVPASLIGELLDRDGPSALGTILARLADGAILDTRVLLAHRLGRDEAVWPCAEDRFASDLLLPERIEDPWLRALTAAALAAPIPIVLGAHTLVGPGLRLAFRRREGRTTSPRRHSRPVQTAATPRLES